MPGGNKVEDLVVDTSAFIKNIQLQDLGTNVFTVQEVVDEILNKRQLRNLVVLPYDLKIKDVFSENIKYITEFSKKTGDYPSLSATDIKVMALTYQLEKEKVGTEHLKKDPQVNRIVSFTAHLTDNHKDIDGFYLPPHKEKEDSETSSATPNNETSVKCDVIRTDYDSDEELHPTFAEHEEGIRQGILADRLSNLGDQELGGGGDGEYEYDQLSEDESSEGWDDNDWITPTNIAQVKRNMCLDEPAGIPVLVACITADFAMQNVLKQIGLQVLSIEGRIIQQLRTFILRCYSCFKTTSIMTKLFCPHCGNKTLKRVAVSLREDGTQEIHLSARKRLTGRGKRFSLPKPQGGKHANNPILCEDQRIPHQRPTRLARTKNNPLDPDYTAGYSPFIMRDINSRAAMLGIRGTETKNWMRRNPNEVKKKGKKKK